MRDAVWYHVYPLGFVGAPPTHQDDRRDRRLRRLGPWLDHIVELGAEVLLLGPIFESETHGYDTTDYLRIDARLGDHGDFDWLVGECSDRGVRVVLDGVFNHVGRSFHGFADVLANGRSSPYGSWFHLDFDGEGPDGFHYRSFEGHQQLVRLNHGEPAVVDLLTDVALRWLDRGAAGWRLDAAYALPPSFVGTLVERVRARHPDAYLFGEVIHGDYESLVVDTGLEAVTQYELWKAVWSSINDRNFYELTHALDRHTALLERFVPVTFVGNHDVTRIASQLNDRRHLPHALALLLTVPGTPCVYAGDELAMEGVKRHDFGGDDAIRPAFPARPADVDSGWDVFALHRELIALRRQLGTPSAARLRVVRRMNEHLAYDVEGDVTLRVLLNLSDDEVVLPSGDGAVVAGRALVGGGTAALPGHGWAVLRA